MSDQVSPEQNPNQETRSSFREFKLIPIASASILQTLDLNAEIIPNNLRESITESEWFSADEGRVLIELRNRQKLYQQPQGLLYISDFDDTLFAATEWHNEEFQRLTNDPNLDKRGIKIPEKVGKELYDQSKIAIGDIQEPRYIPKVNLILASSYAKSIERGEPHEQAWDNALKVFHSVYNDLKREGKASFDKYDLDEDVMRCLLGNHTKEFIYDYFARYFTEGTETKGTRAVVSRGTIEDAFGQVYKMHTSGLLEQGLGTDIAIYTTDLKADYLPILYQLLPGAVENGTRVFDDNPSEIDKYISWARSHGLRNWEVIRVVHPKTKRIGYLDLKGRKPDVTWGNQAAPRFEIYSASTDAPKS